MDFSEDFFCCKQTCFETDEKKESDLIDSINLLLCTPQIIYRITSNVFIEKKFPLSSEGLADYLTTLFDTPLNVKITDTHLSFTEHLKVLITDMPQKFIDEIVYNKKRVFLKEEKNPQTKRVRCSMYKHNSKIFIDKIQIIFWVVFYIFVFIPNRFRALKTFILGALSLLDEKYKNIRIRNTRLPLPFEDCVDLQSLRCLISNPIFYKKIIDYIYIHESCCKNTSKKRKCTNTY